MRLKLTWMAAAQVLKGTANPAGDYNAGQLNALVALWPDPFEAAKLMKLDMSGAPVLFQDITMQDVAASIQNFIEGGQISWPLFWLPDSYSKSWADDPGARGLMAFLQQHNLGVQLTIGGQTTWFRGDWMIACDMRLRFEDGVTRQQLEQVEHARLVYQKTGVLPKLG